jgi:hypothetical protein
MHKKTRTSTGSFLADKAVFFFLHFLENLVFMPKPLLFSWTPDKLQEMTIKIAKNTLKRSHTLDNSTYLSQITNKIKHQQTHFTGLIARCQINGLTIPWDPPGAVLKRREKN